MRLTHKTLLAMAGFLSLTLGISEPYTTSFVEESTFRIPDIGVVSRALLGCRTMTERILEDAQDRIQ
jgi:hypothetical protein